MPISIAVNDLLARKLRAERAQLDGTSDFRSAIDWTRPPEEPPPGQPIEGLKSGLCTAIERIYHAMTLNQSHADSPIEVIFGSDLIMCLKEALPQHQVALVKQGAACDPNAVLVVPQYWWCRYRFDFAVATPAHKPLVFIECDGKEFHSTPKQLERDRLKNAIATAGGVAVYRVSSSEIFKRSRSHAQEVARVIAERISG